MQKKRKAYRYLCVILFSIIFPYLVTVFSMRKTEEKVYLPEPCGRTIRLKNEVAIDLEKFLPYVLYASLPRDYPQEVLKMQIVMLRTYILRSMGTAKEIDVSSLGLPYLTNVELEREWGDAYEKYWNEAMRYVCETSRQVLWYQGELIYPYYHEVSEGTTCVGEFDYLQPAVSSEDTTADAYLHIFYFTPEQLVEICNKEWEIQVDGTSFLSQVTVEKYENCNYVSKVKIGEEEITADDFMRAFSLASTAFSVEAFADGVKMVCKGKGNGKGVSIYGACCMAEEGSTYLDILRHYYTGIEIGQMR